MLPTPDWSGRNSRGTRPTSISLARNSATFWPIRLVTRVGRIEAADFVGQVALDDPGDLCRIDLDDGLADAIGGS